MAKRKARLPEGGLIFSSEAGRTCPRCERPVDACTCGERADVAPDTDGVVRVSFDRKRGKGKGVTCITGVPLKPSELEAFAKRLKKRCSSGGTAKDGAIEVQGDHRDVLVPLLEAEGWVVKRAGG